MSTLPALEREIGYAEVKPGIPDMYETEPNIPATDQYISRVFRTELDHVDGSIVNWPAYLSQEVVEAAKRQVSGDSLGESPGDR